MVAFIDTNVIIDIISQRMPFASNAQKILKLCDEKVVQGCISSQSILDIFYILRKACPIEDLRAFFIEMSLTFDFIGADKETMLKALHNSDFNDIEDCVQAECAIKSQADYIITRNTKDFSLSKIPAITPEDFLSKISKRKTKL